jgi:hypothetical protein
MYKLALVLSLVIWAVVIAIIFSTPTDVRRTVQMLKDTRGKTTPPSSASLRARSEADQHGRKYVHSPGATCSPLGRTEDLDARMVQLWQAVWASSSSAATLTGPPSEESRNEFGR